jgi:type IV fimbrial biogenesis protein FimT
VAVLAAIAAPSFKSLIQSQVMSGSVNSFLADMRFARSESIRLGGGVVMCRSNSPEATNPVCNSGAGADGNGWTSGWIIFHDLNKSGTKTSTEPLLRVQGPLTSMDSVIETNSSPSYKFQFDATGRLPLSSATTLQFGGNDNFSNLQQRTLCVSVGGRGRIAGDGLATCN